MSQPIEETARRYDTEPEFASRVDSAPVPINPEDLPELPDQE